jgi:hypothetical protein
MKLPVILSKTADATIPVPYARMSNALIATLILLSFSILSPTRFLAQSPKPAQPAAAPVSQPALERHYVDGETITYRMTGVNHGHERTIRYEARAEGAVKKAPSGVFLEEFAWKNLHVNGQPFALSPASQEFRESVSLAPGFPFAIPDLSKVQPILIGPITDLLAFYADTMLTMRQTELVHAGDHVYVKNGAPNSWADGTYVVFGQDAIDFDITLQSIDQAAKVATVIVRHVPPAQPQIKMPAAWMLSPVGESPNNWVEVEKGQNGKFTAAVGRETFEAMIKISMDTGRILSATMDNPVDVLERDCDDAALTVCGSPVLYGIRRQITLDAEPAQAPNPSK